MAIVQTAKNGIPLLDGIFYPAYGSYVQYSIQSIGDRRILTAQARRQGLPEHVQHYFYYYTDELQVPAGKVLRIGYLRHLRCGAAIMFHAESEAVEWIASFSYAAAFEHGSLHQNRLLLHTADSELWQFDLTLPRSVRISILTQSDKITRIK